MVVCRDAIGGAARSMPAIFSCSLWEQLLLMVTFFLVDIKTTAQNSRQQLEQLSDEQQLL